MQFNFQIPYAELTGRHVVLGLSGGVDSSVSAALLKAQGLKVTALFMKNWEEDDTESYCAAAEDRKDAQMVCDILGIELKTINFAAEYWDRVFEHFLAEYAAGRTPNPDILCNKEIKFKAFFDYAVRILKADFIATGHYARVEVCSDGQNRLCTADSAARDQSYMLYRLPQEVLSRLILPLGNFEKDDVREIARDIELACADAPDSMEICFIPDGEYAAFIRARGFTPKNGHFIGPDGEDLGPHAGVDHYTVGQRKGLGIAAGRPLFVKAILPDGNIQLAESGGEYASRMTVADIATPDGAPLADGEYRVKVRSAAKAVPCQVCGNPDGTLTVIFPEPVRAPAPGQSAVFYRGGFVFGGGFIHSAE